MKVKKEVLDVIGKKEQFVMGNVACLYGALLAGCRFYAGYPITPSTEIMEGMCRLMPKIDGMAIQMEDEIASLSAVIGASLAGKRAMTATSGPGFSLMQESIGYACMAEVPLVLVNVMRGGPSTGQPTEPAQGDVMQARWGTHGDHEIIAIYPNSVQETLELTIEAFNMADKYRVPVILLMDAELGHMREKITIPDNIDITGRLKVDIDPKKYMPFRTGYTRPNKVPAIDHFGGGYKTYLTGLTHDWSGLPTTTDVEVHKNLIVRLREKITDSLDDIIMIQSEGTDDASTLIVSYGITSRATASAVKAARQDGKKVGQLRLKTLWPFPEEQIRRISKRVDRIIVPELNLGQIYHKVKEAAQGNCQVISLPKVGGAIHTPEEINELIEIL